MEIPPHLNLLVGDNIYFCVETFLRAREKERDVTHFLKMKMFHEKRKKRIFWNTCSIIIICEYFVAMYFLESDVLFETLNNDNCLVRDAANT